MPVNRLRKYLDDNGVKYVVISHSLAYTAQGVAALAHVRGNELAKCVIVKVDGQFAMAVLPASRQLDLLLLKAAAHAGTVELASEAEFKSRFPDCDTGAMPPFGNLYEMRVFADEALSRDSEIAFNAGSHLELIRLAWSDFERLVRPAIVQIAVKLAVKSAA